MWELEDRHPVLPCDFEQRIPQAIARNRSAHTVMESASAFRRFGVAGRCSFAKAKKCRQLASLQDYGAGYLLPSFRSIDKLRDWLSIRKMRKGRFTEEQMVAIIREADRDQVSAVAKRQGISEQTIYVWRSASAALRRMT